MASTDSAYRSTGRSPRTLVYAPSPLQVKRTPLSPTSTNIPLSNTLSPSSPPSIFSTQKSVRPVKSTPSLRPPSVSLTGRAAFPLSPSFPPAVPADQDVTDETIASLAPPQVQFHKEIFIHRHERTFPHLHSAEPAHTAAYASQSLLPLSPPADVNVVPHPPSDHIRTNEPLPTTFSNTLSLDPSTNPTDSSSSSTSCSSDESRLPLRQPMSVLSSSQPCAPCRPLSLIALQPTGGLFRAKPNLPPVESLSSESYSGSIDSHYSQRTTDSDNRRESDDMSSECALDFAFDKPHFVVVDGFEQKPRHAASNGTLRAADTVTRPIGNPKSKEKEEEEERVSSMMVVRPALVEAQHPHITSASSVQRQDSYTLSLSEFAHSTPSPTHDSTEELAIAFTSGRTERTLDEMDENREPFWQANIEYSSRSNGKEQASNRVDALGLPLDGLRKCVSDGGELRVRYSDDLSLSRKVSSAPTPRAPSTPIEFAYRATPPSPPSPSGMLDSSQGNTGWRGWLRRNSRSGSRDRPAFVLEDGLGAGQEESNWSRPGTSHSHVSPLSSSSSPHFSSPPSLSPSYPGDASSTFSSAILTPPPSARTLDRATFESPVSTSPSLPSEMFLNPSTGSGTGGVTYPAQTLSSYRPCPTTSHSAFVHVNHVHQINHADHIGSGDSARSPTGAFKPLMLGPPRNSISIGNKAKPARLGEIRNHLPTIAGSPSRIRPLSLSTRNSSGVGAKGVRNTSEDGLRGGEPSPLATERDSFNSHFTFPVSSDAILRRNLIDRQTNPPIRPSHERTYSTATTSASSSPTSTNAHLRSRSRAIGGSRVVIIDQPRFDRASNQANSVQEGLDVGSTGVKIRGEDREQMQSKTKMQTQKGKGLKDLIYSFGERIGRWMDETLPAQAVFLLGFILGPWCWVLGGWGLSSDGALILTKFQGGRSAHQADNPYYRWRPPSVSSSPSSSPLSLAPSVFGDRSQPYSFPSAVSGARPGNRRRVWILPSLRSDSPNKWVWRNRVAAILSGLVVIPGLILAVLFAIL
ncbi:hypothetical protein [Phaffia rhodozyma]|uniref:Uncharacterized protein n=1 Tax=Phaffia rhodozyma TaxID=264483 RepID=A0A0F7SQX0_PHARH|nr:hypothetical protein [Phaffia rhodozyma]